MYTIVDIETTGKSNKITEIAILKYNGQDLIDSFTTLVNPESHIPDYITQLTGISNAMVNDAPKFSEIAKHILEITHGAVFVAHNANFDYKILKKEFKAIGVTFKRTILCTVKLSRQLLPGHQSYSLGKLCDDLNIDISNRHRAHGDAEATLILFHKLLHLKSSHVAFNQHLNRIVIKNQLLLKL